MSAMIEELTPRKPNRQVESMTNLYLPQLPSYRVRVWRTEESVADSINPAKKQDLYEAAAYLRVRNAGMEEVVEHFAAMDRVAAVEVTSPSGQGVIIYPDWK